MTSPTPIFCGKLVNLKIVDPEQLSKVYVSWHRNTVYHRLADDDPARLLSAQADREWIEAHWNEMIMFGIHDASNDRLIGSIELLDFSWSSGDAEVGIGIGESAYQGKGYGTEAMQILLRYAFEELGLHRVSLSVFEYNTRGIRSYEKAGFQQEGRIRQYVFREGKTWDLLIMGILRSEWEATLRSE